MLKCKLRVVSLLFIFIFFSGSFLQIFSVPIRELKAAQVGVVITEELAKQILLKVAKEAGDKIVSDYVAPNIQKKLGIDPAPVVSSSSFPKFSESDRIEDYIKNHGSQRLAQTWVDLNKQFLNFNGTVDNEYYVAFYQALANSIVNDANNVLNEIHNDYLNSNYRYDKLSDSLKQAFMAYPIYIVFKQRNSAGDYLEPAVVYFFDDVYYGITSGYITISANQIFYKDVIAGCVGFDNRGEFRFCYSNTRVYFEKGGIFSDYYGGSAPSKILSCLMLYTPEYSDYLSRSNHFVEGYDILNVGLTPEGFSLLNSGSVDGHLKDTLNEYKDSDTSLPIFVQKPGTDGKSVGDYVGNTNTTILQLDLDTDNIYPAFTFDEDTTTLKTVDDVDKLDFSPVDQEGVAKKKWGWLEFLFGWFQKIIDAILSLVSGIVDGILNGIGDVLKGLFVPSDGFFIDHFSSIKNTLAEKFGFSNYELLFDALKSCARGSWDFSGDFTFLGKEYHLTMIDVDEWFKDKNLNKLHYIVRGFVYPFLAIANVNYIVWFLRGNVFNVGTAISNSNIASEINPDKSGKG